jgi:hypothetical protein
VSREALGMERDETSAEATQSPRRRAGDAAPSRGVPEAVRDAARRAFDARPLDVVVADLVFDSLLDGDRRAGVDPAVRTLRFGSADGGADLTVAEDGESVRIGLQTLPRAAGEIEVRGKGATFTVTADATGFAEFRVPAGLLSLVIRPADPPHPWPLQTAWVRV